MKNCISLSTSGRHILYEYACCFPNFRDTNKDYAASFPMLTFTVCSHVLVYGEARSNTKAAHFLVWVCCFHSFSALCPSTHESHQRPPFKADSGTDNKPCPRMAPLCSRSSSEVDFMANGAWIWAQDPRRKTPYFSYNNNRSNWNVDHCRNKC